MPRMRTLPYILMILTAISMTKLRGWANRADRRCYYFQRKPPYGSFMDKTDDYGPYGPPTVHVKQSKLSSKTSTGENMFLECLEIIFDTTKIGVRRKRFKPDEDK